MKIVNPLSPSLAEEDIKTVLYALAGQGGCDGEPYDQIQQAADYIAELEKKLIESIELIEDLKSYVPEYFWEKHKYQDDLDRLREERVTECKTIQHKEDE